jgi:hypothetical protein
MTPSPFEQMFAGIEDNLAKLARMRERLDPEQIVAMRGAFERRLRDLRGEARRRRRGDGSMPALVEPPRGPKPFAGGAAAALEFDD